MTETERADYLGKRLALAEQIIALLSAQMRETHERAVAATAQAIRDVIDSLCGDSAAGLLAALADEFKAAAETRRDPF